MLFWFFLIIIDPLTIVISLLNFVISLLLILISLLTTVICLLLIFLCLLLIFIIVPLTIVTILLLIVICLLNILISLLLFFPTLVSRLYRENVSTIDTPSLGQFQRSFNGVNCQASLITFSNRTSSHQSRYCANRANLLIVLVQQSH